MQILERNGRITLLRASYDPTSKRTRQLSLGTLRLENLKTVGDVPGDLLAKLTANESDQLNEWLQVRAAGMAAAENRSRLSYAHVSLAKIADALESGEPAGDLKKMLLEVERIAKGIKKRGLKKKDLRAKKETLPDPTQVTFMEMLAEDDKNL